MSALLETGGMTRLTCGRSYSALAVRVRQPELGYQVALREQGYEPASVDDADYWLAQCFTLPAGCTALCVPLDDGLVVTLSSSWGRMGGSAQSTPWMTWG